MTTTIANKHESMVILRGWSIGIVTRTHPDSCRYGMLAPTTQGIKARTKAIGGREQDM